MKKIGGLLGRSPFGPLYEQMVKVSGAVDELPKLMAAMAKGERAKVSRSAERIRRIEREADDIKSDIRDRLSSSLFTLVDRSETLVLVSSIDAIADDALRVAKLVSVRRTRVHASLGGDLVALAERARGASRELLGILGHVRDLMHGSAKRGEATKVLKRITALSEIDSILENAEIEVLQGLFAREDEVGPIDVMVIMHIVRQLADTSRRAENVADAIRRIVLNR